MPVANASKRKWAALLGKKREGGKLLAGKLCDFEGKINNKINFTQLARSFFQA